MRTESDFNKPAICVVGAGLNGRDHIERLTRQRRTDVSAVVAPTLPRKNAVEAIPTAGWHSPMSPSLDREDVNAVLIATTPPGCLHRDMLLQVSGAGLTDSVR